MDVIGLDLTIAYLPAFAISLILNETLHELNGELLILAIIIFIVGIWINSLLVNGSLTEAMQKSMKMTAGVCTIFVVGGAIGGMRWNELKEASRVAATAFPIGFFYIGLKGWDDGRID